MIYSRFKYNGLFLKEEDFCENGGFGFDSDHYLKVIKKRRKLRKEGIPNRFSEEYLTLEDFSQKWDSRTGYYIDGTEIIRKYHFFHNFDIYDTKKNRTLKIDAITIHHFRGKYLTLSLRDENNSHSTVNYMNYTCYDSEFIEDITENQRRYQLVPKKQEYEVIANENQLEEIGITYDISGEKVKFKEISPDTDWIVVEYVKDKGLIKCELQFDIRMCYLKEL
jgi:hypothetical protein